MSNTKVVPAEVETVEVVPTVDPATEWGPYKELSTIQTPYGQYGVPRGHIMYFVEEEIWDKKNHRKVRTMVPKYRKVRIDESDTRPSTALRGKTDKENLDNVMAYSKMNKERQERRRLDRQLAES
jgi:hypothetical protein